MTTPSRSSGAADAGGHGFGTAPVYLASISTILGAVIFLRFGYAVANVGLLGTFAMSCLESFSRYAIPFSSPM